jgi:hypothetical protein
MMKAELFRLGQIVATPAALSVAGTHITTLLSRHVSGDWGSVPAEDAAANEEALQRGERIISCYELPDGQKIRTVWLITEADRSATTVLLPEEY